MAQNVPRIVLLAFLACSLGCSFGGRLPAAAEQALRQGEGFELLSLDPDLREGPVADGFHGWRVLGTTKVNDAATRAKLIARLKQGVAENDNMAAACFIPRHGIRVSHAGQVHEFVICFQCLSVAWYIDGQKTKGFLISESPQAAFDEVLKKAGVPLAAKPEG